MKTVMQELLELIPDAAEIKAAISEHDMDEKMLDEWLWNRIYKGNVWLKKELQQMVYAHVSCVKNGYEKEGNKDWTSEDDELVRSDIEQYYNDTFNNQP